MIGSEQEVVVFPPYQVDVLVTKTCNLRCLHCYVTQGKDQPPLNRIKALIDQLVENSVFRITIEGGEPLIRRDIFDILDYLVVKKVKPLVGTNGTLINARTAARLAEIGCTFVQVSSDGATSKTHNSIRGPNAFERTVHGCELLVIQGVSVRPNPVAMRYYIRGIPVLIDLALCLKVSTLRIIGLVSPAVPGQGGKPDRTQVRELLSYLDGRRNELEGRLNLMTAFVDSHNLHQPFKADSFFLASTSTNQPAQCWAGTVASGRAAVGGGISEAPALLFER